MKIYVHSSAHSCRDLPVCSIVCTRLVVILNGSQPRKCLAGSFGLCDPASKEMHHYLERLEEQQRLVLELITGKKQALLDHMQSKDGLRIKQVISCSASLISLWPLL